MARQDVKDGDIEVKARSKFKPGWYTPGIKKSEIRIACLAAHLLQMVGQHRRQWREPPGAAKVRKLTQSVMRRRPR